MPQTFNPKHDDWLQEIVPPQQTGQATVTKSRLRCKSPLLAGEYYARASARLLDVNKWHDYTGKGRAIFQLTDQQGHAVSGPAGKGNYFRIDIPGPGNAAGDGDDWVQVQETGERNIAGRRLTFMTVRAADNPLQPTQKTAHFFDRAATSTFMVYLEGLTVTAAVYGRNEHANLRNQGFINKLRNWLIYLGAQLGFSKLQWKSLTEGLLQVE
jgi:hypothetical protein